VAAKDRRSAGFIAALPEALRPAAEACEGLEELLAERLATARAAWPDVAVADDAVLVHLASRLSPGEPSVAAALTALRVDGLYLVAGCVQGDDKAIARLTALADTQADVVLRRMRLQDAEIDEIKQRLRVSLLVAEKGKPAKIQKYAGEGDLAAWLRTCARRLALTEREQSQRHAAADEEALLELAAATGNPESRYLKERYGQTFRAACAEALRSLNDRQRTVLRHYFLDDLTIEHVGAICGVSRATATRWIREARDTLMERLREALARQPDAGSVELESVIRLLDSRLDQAAAVLRVGLTPPGGKGT
jgi:RNA polymerase sigma-70 factor (ECF subfamily)